MENEVDEDVVLTMLEMGDPNKRGYVDLTDFVDLMHSIGLIPDKDHDCVRNKGPHSHDQDQNDLDKEHKKAMKKHKRNDKMIY